jgi:xanthine/CO dehydrogenase XdhC/CoxF family maturation factor
MSEIIYPRSSRETMDGWMHLARYIDKIRLHLAGKLAPDYQPNMGRGFDGMWLQAAGLSHEQVVEVVRNAIIDGQVCDWVRQNVKRTATEKAAHAQAMLNRPASDDPAAQARLQQRKQEFGLAHRNDIKTFVDLNDADEKRI